MRVKEVMKRHFSWPLAGTVGGGATGLALTGLGGAGIVALGGGIGVPFFLITAGAGALGGVAIDQVSKYRAGKNDDTAGIE